MFSDPFGDLEALGEEVDEGSVDVVDAVAAIFEYGVDIHEGILAASAVGPRRGSLALTWR